MFYIKCVYGSYEIQLINQEKEPQFEHEHENGPSKT
jgi:hypothetical protein